MVPHPLSRSDIINRETCRFPTWRVPHYGEFSLSQSNSMDVGIWDPRPKERESWVAAVLRWEVVDFIETRASLSDATYHAGWCKSFTICAKVLAQNQHRTDIWTEVLYQYRAYSLLTRGKIICGMLLCNIQ